MRIWLRTTGLRRLIVGTNKIKSNLPIASKREMWKYAHKLKRKMIQVIEGQSIYHTDYANPAGKLTSQFRVFKTANGYDVVNYHPGAGAIDEGSRGTWILPHGDYPLRLHDGGRAKIVHHPGVTRPMRFRERAINETREKFRGDMNKMIQKEIRRSFK